MSDAILVALGTLLPVSFRVTGYDVYRANSDIAEPYSWSPPTLTRNPDEIEGVARAGQVRFEGKAIGNGEAGLVLSRVSIAFFGLMVEPPSMFRFQQGDYEQFDEVIAILNNSTADPYVPCAVNGYRAIFSNYVNFQYNSHYETLYRTS